jgi:cytosine/adenosine deaminase-related metal-dependent hydrolase
VSAVGALLLRRARPVVDGVVDGAKDLLLADGRVVEPGASAPAAAIDLDGLLLLPAFVNAHDVLDAAALPPLGRGGYASVYEWSREAEDDAGALAPALAVPLPDRLFLGGLRNLLAGVASVLHHHPDHRSLARRDFPVRVQRRYGFAHSPGLTPRLRQTYRTSDRRVPWIVRAAEGSDPSLRGELDVLAAANVLRQNTVLARGSALEAADAARLAAARACLAWCPEADRRQYGRTPPVRALVDAGVRVGLGTDGAGAGARDLLSTAAVAREAGSFDDVALVRLLTTASAEVARMPVGGFEPGAPADFVATASLDALLGGDRRALALVVVRGEARHGEPSLLEAAGRPLVRLRVDDEERALEAECGRRLATVVRRHPAVRHATWMAGVTL